MAVNPINPAAPAALPPVAAPMAVAALEPTQTVIPTGNAANQNAAGSSTSEQQKASSQPIEKALEEINSQMQAWSTQLQFDVDQDANRVVVSIVDSQTGDVIRTIPSEAVLRIAKMIVKLQGNAIQTEA